MSEIKRRDLEWVAVERIGELLTTPTASQHNVTYAFCLFSSLIAWIRQRVGAYRSYQEWPAALKPLRQEYATPNWGLPAGLSQGRASVTPLARRESRKDIDLRSCEAWELLIVLRNSSAHADANGVRPINTEAQGQPGRLIGYEFTAYDSEKRPSGSVKLNRFEMISFGRAAAKVYLQAFRPSDAALREMGRAA